MKAIVATDADWGIGKNNSLLFSLPEDMKFFRRTTLGKVIVIGRKTLESFPGGKPLPGRTNVVLTSKGNIEGAVTVSDINALMRVLGDFSPNEVFVCGGASVYGALLPYCDEALVTKICAHGGADAFFPNLDELPSWQLSEITREAEDGGLKLQFCVYRNISPVKFFPETAAFTKQNK